MDTDTPPSRAKLTQDLADAIRAQEEIIDRARRALEDLRSQVQMGSTPTSSTPIRLARDVDSVLKGLRAHTGMADVASAAMRLFDADHAEHEEADEHLRRLSSTYRTASQADGDTLRRKLVGSWQIMGRPMPLAMFLADEVRQGRA